MKLKELQKVREALMDLHEFMVANSDRDESGICEELGEAYGEADDLIKKETYNVQLRNAKASIRRKRKNN